MAEEIRTLYLAGPMTGYKDWNIPTFLRVRDELIRNGYNIVIPADLETPDPDHPADDFAWWLGEDVKLILGKCGGIMLLPEWERSRGAKIEVVTGLMKWVKEREFQFYRYRGEGTAERLSAPWVASRLMWKWSLYCRKAGAIAA